MTDPSPNLDVVVLGGGGHVGLPLSLVFAKAGLRVGIYDTNQATLDRIAAGEMPFLENGADELLREVLATGRLEFGVGRLDDRAHRDPGRRHRHPGRRVPRPIDDRLREGRQPDRARTFATARSSSCAARSTRARPSTSPSTSPRPAAKVDVAFCPERIAEGHALEELHSLPQIIGADDDVAAERATTLFAQHRQQDHPDDLQGGRAGQAVHQHLALHEVRGGQPVLHDRRPGRGGLHQRPARHPRGLPAGQGPARSRASPPVRACSRTRCSCRRSRATTSRWGRPRCRSTRACRRTSSRPSSAATAALRGKTVGILGMAFKAESDDTRASLSYKLRKLLAWAGARVVCTDPYVQDDRLTTLDCVLEESDILILGAPHAAYREPAARRQGRRRRVGRHGRRDPALIGVAGPRRHRDRRDVALARSSLIARLRGRSSACPVLDRLIRAAIGLARRDLHRAPPRPGWPAATRGGRARRGGLRRSAADAPAVRALRRRCPSSSTRLVVGRRHACRRGLDDPPAADCPAYWIAFPPIVQAIVLGHPEVLVLWLLVARRARSAGLAAAIKPYAGLPLLAERRWRALVVAGVVLSRPPRPAVGPVPRGAARSSPRRWRRQSPRRLGVRVAGPDGRRGRRPCASLGLRRGLWLAAPVLWPSRAADLQDRRDPGAVAAASRIAVGDPDPGATLVGVVVEAGSSCDRRDAGWLPTGLASSAIDGRVVAAASDWPASLVRPPILRHRQEPA